MSKSIGTGGQINIQNGNNASSSTRAALENKCVEGIRVLSDSSLGKIADRIDVLKIQDSFWKTNKGHVNLKTLGVRCWAKVGGFLDHNSLASLELCFRPLRRRSEWQSVWSRFLSDKKNPTGITFACKRLRHTPETIKQMAKLLGLSNPKVRNVSSDMLVALDAIQEVVDMSTSESIQARVQVANVLGRFTPNADIVKVSVSMLDDDNECVRIEAIQAMSKMGVLAEEFDDELGRCLSDEVDAVKSAAAQCLQSFSERNNNKPFCLTHLMKALSKASIRSNLEDDLLIAISAMGVDGNAELIARLPSAKDDRKYGILRHLMPEFISSRSVETLLECLRHSNPKVRAASVVALAHSLRPLNKRELKKNLY